MGLHPYALIKGGDEQKHKAAKVATESVVRPVVSSQVVSEVCANLLRKAGQDEDFVQGMISSFYSKYEVVCLDDFHLLKASKLRMKYSFSYWDSLIVAAALGASCGVLYSEDMQDGLVIDTCLTIVNPLTAKFHQQKL